MSLTPAIDTYTSSHPVALVLAGAILAGLAALGWPVVQQVRMAPSAMQMTADLLVVSAHPTRDARAAPSAWSDTPSGPAWAVLSAAQKQALTPLQERWAGMGEAQKRRWLVLAQSFASLPAEEQSKLHSRMADWASLSAQQRSQARLNYAMTNRLARSDKRAQWEAYQALSEEEKKRLATHAAPKPSGAATALRPNPARKLVRIPAAVNAAAGAANPPKILLPESLRSQRAASSAPSLPTLASPSSSSSSIHLPSTPSATAVETLPVETPSAIGVALPPLPPSVEPSASGNAPYVPHQPNAPTTPATEATPY